MATAPQSQFYLANSAITDRLGVLLAPHLERGDFVALWGDLGAGKTVLARAVIHARQRLAGRDPDDVQSPTFTLVHPYQAGDLIMSHYDFYRIESESEMMELGVDDALDQGLILAEWPERMGRDLYPDRLDIRLAIDGDGRIATLSGSGSWQERWARLQDQCVFEELEKKRDGT